MLRIVFVASHYTCQKNKVVMYTGSLASLFTLCMPCFSLHSEVKAQDWGVFLTLPSPLHELENFLLEVSVFVALAICPRSAAAPTDFVPAARPAPGGEVSASTSQIGRAHV